VVDKPSPALTVDTTTMVPLGVLLLIADDTVTKMPPIAGPMEGLAATADITPSVVLVETAVVEKVKGKLSSALSIVVELVDSEM
jgi:hypothetical protein